MKDRIIEKSIGLFATLFAYLVYVYVSTFVTQAQFDEYKSNHDKEFLTLTNKVDSLHIKFDNTLTGMCIIEPKTCELKRIK